MRLFADGLPILGAGGPNRRARRPVTLAQQGDFRIGRLLVKPSRRCVEVDGRSHIIEPRVMQVLVTLAQLKGQVVSRDELIHACWNSRIVGEDAVNRTIGRLRRLAEIVGGFGIETVARVGYRLTETSAGPRRRRLPRPSGVALYVLVAGVLLGHAVAAAIVWQRLFPSHWTVVSSRVLVSDAAIERHPAISPDGRLIAYAGGDDVLSRQIFVRLLAGGDPVKVTDEPADHTSVSWSPDGRELAYVLYRAGAPCTLVIRPMTGGEPQTLGRCQTDERSEVVWSRAGDVLYFVDRPSRSASERIMRLVIATGARSDFTHPPAGTVGDGDIGLSPDGRWMSFNRQINRVTEALMVRDLQSGAERVLDGMCGGMDPGGWTNDSRTILLAGRVNGDNVIWAYPVAGGPPTHVMSGPLEMGRLATGPGDIAAVKLDNQIFSLALAPSAKGGQPQFLDGNNAVSGAPAIGPGGVIAVAGGRNDEFGVWVRRPGEAFHRLAAAHVDEVDDLSFSPDGSKLVYTTEVGGGPGLKIVGLDGTDYGSIRFSGSEVGAPTWDADGQSLIFPGRDAVGWRLWRVTAPFKTPQPASGYGWLSVRVFGGHLYGVRVDSPGVWRIDGTPTRVAPLPGSAFPDLWTISGGAIDYVDDPFGHPPRIMSQPIAGGPARVIAEVPGYNPDDSFAVDPRTGAILYAATRIDATNLELLHLALR